MIEWKQIPDMLFRLQTVSISREKYIITVYVWKLL